MEGEEWLRNREDLFVSETTADVADISFSRKGAKTQRKAPSVSGGLPLRLRAFAGENLFVPLLKVWGRFCGALRQF